MAEYAGFWLRLVAYIIDNFVLTGLIMVVFIPLSILSVVSENLAMAIGIPLYFGVPWLYYALMESSKTQGTLGKMALGIKVTDINGKTVSFWRATGRHFGKIVSSLILIGYIMIAFTGKKQGMHDIMADCLVVKKKQFIS